MSRTRGYACGPRARRLQAYTHLQTGCYGYVQHFPTALEKREKRRQPVEREMDQRDEEITRADAKRVKGNKRRRKSPEEAFSWARMLGSVGAGHIVGDALQQSALVKNDS